MQDDRARISGIELTQDRRRFLRGASATGLSSALALGARPIAARAAALEKMSLRFNWTIKGEFTPFFVARERGFFREQGLDVELLEGKSGTEAVEVVGTGHDQFGYVPSIQVIQGIDHGIPVKTVATCGKYTGMCWTSWPNVPLTGPKSLEGHRVSISPSSTFFQIWPAFAKKFGVDRSKVEVVGADPSARVGLFLRHQLDILADVFVANDYVIVKLRAGEPLHLLRLSDLDFDPLGYLLVANTSFMKANPGLVRRFVRATLKGFKYTMDHTDQAVAIMTKLYGGRLGPKVIAGQVHGLLTLINTTPSLGANDDAAWQKSLALLHDSGVVGKSLAQTHYYTNAFV